MTRQENSSEIPDWKCERYLLGELDESEMDRIRQRLAHDDALSARLAELERSNRELLQRHPVAIMAKQIERKLAAAQPPAIQRSERRSWGRPRLVWAPVAIAAVVALFLLLNPGAVTEQGFPGLGPFDNSTTRIKGPVAVLSLYRRTAGGSERLENRAVAAEHDLIRARYHSDGQTYGLILSVDGRGVLTRHLPQRDSEAVLMAAGSHTLDFSSELDDAPLWEIFVLASSTAPFAVDRVIDSIEGSPLMQSPGLSVAEAEAVLLSLELPEDILLSTLTLIKKVGDEQ